MKKHLLFILALSFIVSKTFAQGPTLTSANSAPAIGDAFADQFALTANVEIKTGGANQTWDYSGLIDSNAALIGYTAVVPSETPFADSFPGSNLTVKTLGDSVYIYYNSQTDALRGLGVALQDSTVLRYIKPRIFLPYPFSYNSFFTDTVAEVLPVINQTYGGRDSVYGDGYGTLKIPGKTYNDVLRIKYIENISFTEKISGIKFTFRVRTITYAYYTPGTHAPLLSIAESEVSNPLTGNTSSRDITYLKTFVLPVSFASFNATLNNREILLQWKTGQEINTANFNVQRSLTGDHFINIAQVKASGVSTGAQYNYTDDDFVKTGVPQVVYYRIQETDKDGRQYNSVVNIIRNKTSNLSVYPNPVKSFINLNIADAAVADAVVIYDAKGHMLQQLRNHPVNQPINVSNLSKGTYFIQVKIKDNTSATTIVKE